MWIHKTLSVSSNNMHNVNIDKIAVVQVMRGLVLNEQRQHTLHEVMIWSKRTEVIQ